METVELILGILLLVLSVIIIACVMIQSSKDKKSGVITGVAETFFSKGKTGRWDKKLNYITIAASSVFAILIIVLYCIA